MFDMLVQKSHYNRTKLMKFRLGKENFCPQKILSDGFLTIRYVAMAFDFLTTEKCLSDPIDFRVLCRINNGQLDLILN